MPSDFPDTRWSLIVRIRATDSDDAFLACAELCREYWVPLYQFLRLQGDTREQAEDVVQGFFEKLLEKEWLRSVEQPASDESAEGIAKQGRLRTFLLACLRAYRAKVHRHDRAEKRGGRFYRILGDFGEAESGLVHLSDRGLRPDEVFDRSWALTVIRKATSTLRERYRVKGRGDRFRLLETYLSGVAPGAIANLARQLGEEETTLRSDLHRLRKRLREQVRTEVAATLDPSSGVSAEEELANLMEALR